MTRPCAVDADAHTRQHNISTPAQLCSSCWAVASCLCAVLLPCMGLAVASAICPSSCVHAHHAFDTHHLHHMQTHHHLMHPSAEAEAAVRSDGVAPLLLHTHPPTHSPHTALLCVCVCAAPPPQQASRTFTPRAPSPAAQAATQSEQQTKQVGGKGGSSKEGGGGGVGVNEGGCGKG